MLNDLLVLKNNYIACCRRMYLHNEVIEDASVNQSTARNINFRFGTYEYYRFKIWLVTRLTM